MSQEPAGTTTDDECRILTSIDCRAMEICPSLAVMPGFNGGQLPRRRSEQKAVSNEPPPADTSKLESEFSEFANKYRGHGKKGVPVRCVCGCGQRWPGGVGECARSLGANYQTLKTTLWRFKRFRFQGHEIVRAEELSVTHDSTEAA